jgi:phospholipase C
LIAPGTVFRAPDSGPPFDHTSILKTVETRWGLTPLTARDAAAADVGSVLTLATPRTDDPLAGVQVPQSGVTAPNADEVSHLQKIHAELVASLPVPGEPGSSQRRLSSLKTRTEVRNFIQERTEAWKAAK